jgi:hypothetical protein
VELDLKITKGYRLLWLPVKDVNFKIINQFAISTTLAKPSAHVHTTVKAAKNSTYMIKPSANIHTKVLSGKNSCVVIKPCAAHTTVKTTKNSQSFVKSYMIVKTIMNGFLL